MSDDPSVTDLVTRARNGDKQAWDALVERYTPLVWSMRYARRRLGPRADQVRWLTADVLTWQPPATVTA